MRLNMSVSIKAYNDERAKKRLNDLTDNIVNAINRSLAKDIVLMDADVKKSIQQGTRSGRVYKRRSVRHRASAAGEFPKTDTGQLVSGFNFKLPKRKRRLLTAELENKTKHAKYLEFKPSSQGGRPFMRPTANKWRPIIKKNLDNAVKREINKADA